MNPILFVSSSTLTETLSTLQEAGRRNSERVVLWLARCAGQVAEVECLWMPEQVAGYDYFEIPPKAMEQLFVKLRQHRWFVGAQVHTHPGRAFHSQADDRWAIVRHVGALSLVVPDFGLKTDTASFLEHTAVFSLSPQNKWIEAPRSQITNFYRIHA
jgi:hypothetical protein